MVLCGSGKLWGEAEEESTAFTRSKREARVRVYWKGKACCGAVTRYHETSEKEVEGVGRVAERGIVQKEERRK